MSTQDSSGERRLGWHWLWFLPLCLMILLVVELHTAHLAFVVLKLGYQRWDWGGLISPSAAFCLTVIAISIWWPILSLWFVTLLVKSADNMKASQRWLYSVLLIVGIFLLPFLTDALMWGSFPFIIDDEGVSRLRMIPFIPWPSGHFGEY
jgi:hypothetical protein